MGEVSAVRLRLALLPLALAFLGACSSNGDSWSDLQRIIAPEASFDPRFAALVERDPRALQVAFPDQGVSSTILLASSRAGLDTWMTPDGATITTEAGMLRATRGLGIGLLAADIDQPLALVRARREGLSERFHTYLTGNDKAVIRAYRCIVKDRGPSHVDFPAGPRQTRLMQEDCRSLDQEFFNLYWVSPEGEILQARQWTGDYLGIMTLRVVPR